ncbi:methyltransferase domain-containing protein [Flavihumibacter petaseus]|uniref:Putative methyltransferase n=1 Tax=Flavihumibacter petaseus NBRC 106054 TaxID=1220578 RepID=A0A0E9N383_9BACT|nr:methyltransferase domain-containing protein [Flavihumibacter petaseus]GAO44294.1 putative methyltransferase [Flavihumibacter petaseus NBRC 106054]
MDTVLDKSFWDGLYRNNETKWDLGTVSGPIQSYIDQLTDKSLRILIPGCGNAYEAGYFLERGFENVTVVDISELAVNAVRSRLKQYLGNSLTVINDDFFSLTGQYDLVVEQTFFCALNPQLRPDYVRKMASLLPPGGKLAGVLFNCEFEAEGPPFGGNQAAYEELFCPAFKILTMAPCFNSILPRQGNELFIRLTSKA